MERLLLILPYITEICKKECTVIRYYRVIIFFYYVIININVAIRVDKVNK